MARITVSIDARRYADSDDCLTDAARDYAAEHDLVGWDLSPRWADDQRDAILLDVPESPAVVLGRRGGSRASEAQKAAARANGRKGGRPRRGDVTIHVVEVGQAFGCCAIIRDARGRKIAETDDVRPYGFDGNAYRDGERLCAARGWTVASDERDDC